MRFDGSIGDSALPFVGSGEALMVPILKRVDNFTPPLRQCSFLSLQRDFSEEGGGDGGVPSVDAGGRVGAVTPPPEVSRRSHISLIAVGIVRVQSTC